MSRHSAALRELELIQIFRGAAAVVLYHVTGHGERMYRTAQAAGVQATLALACLLLLMVGVAFHYVGRASGAARVPPGHEDRAACAADLSRRSRTNDPPCGP